MAEMSRAAYILALVGGIILFLFGLLTLLGYAVGGPSLNLLPIRGMNAGIIELVCGVIAIVCAKYATDILWAIVLIVVGIIGGGLGGLLVLIGGIIGLVVGVTAEEKAHK